MASSPAMPELLERSGFRLRGPKRADCAHCTGHSRGTVSYTAEVAYCHRCGWRGNITTLARQPKVGADPRVRATPGSSPRLPDGGRHTGLPLQDKQHRAMLQDFAAWREAQITALSDRLYALHRCARHAHNVLRKFPDCEAAWDALKRLADEEAELYRALDFLNCQRASAWLENDATVLDVFRAWEQGGRP